MSFISPEFVIFFCVVVPLFFALPHKRRWLMLLIFSYFFYAYGNWQYVPILIFTTLVDYYAALRIAEAKTETGRRWWLTTSMGTNLGVLFIFKYFNFFNQSLAAVAGYDAFTLNLALPIGISFYTFQSMSYTIDVYRRQMHVERNLGIMAAFVVFFPQLVAGPIERATNLLDQFKKEMHWDTDRIVSGLQLMLWGFFKKVVIADRLSVYVNAVYNDVTDYQGLSLILATVFFAFQIYCDFSAYSDIGIGAARVLGFDLMTNFRQPYFSQSVREFWARWHISLSTWFRDYVYIPLGGNRKGFARNLLNLFIVFFLSGLWHGASWTFVMWGTLHGLAVVFLATTRHLNIRFMEGKNPAMVAMRWLLTFVFVCFTWIFFRANTWADAVYIVQNLLNINGSLDLTLPFLAKGETYAMLGAQNEFYLSFILIGLLFVADMLMAKLSLSGFLARTPVILRWGLYYGLAAAVLFSGLYGMGAGQFIYFQF
jgi:alginate O-acetyltransferase complex protein AlgI